MYNLLKFIHIIGVIGWVGGLFTLLVLNLRFSRSGQTAVIAALGQQGRFFAALFMPAALLVIITGIGLVQVGRLGFSPFWVTWGMTGAILSFVIGGALTGGTARRMAKETDPQRIAVLRRRMLIFATLNLLLLVSVVWAMVIKP